MSYNSIGKILKLTTWGESHGAEIGAVLDGVPSNIKISESYIQKFLDMRSPGSSKFVTQRKEKDKINIVADLASKSAVEKLEKIGGSIQIKK